MKRIFLLLIVSMLSVETFGQIKQQRVQPVYVAAKLLDMVEAESYPDVVSYYGYERDSTAPKGVNRYTYQGSTAVWLDSLIEEADSIHELSFFTPQSASTIEVTLLQNGYVKTNTPLVDKPNISGTRFEKRNRLSQRSRVIILQPGSPNTLHLLHKR